MTTEYLTEQEQIQQLKTWVKQYGLTILAGIIFALLLTTGWHHWQDYRNRILTHASAVYDEMLTARAQGNTSTALVQAKKILDHYANTPYAQMASFMLARDAVLKKNYPEAITQLNSVIKHSKDKSMRGIAQLRLARIFIAQQKPQDALTLLQSIDDKNLSGLIDEERGDAYLAMNDPAAARKSYGLALQELPSPEQTRPILQMKFDNLAT